VNSSLRYFGCVVGFGFGVVWMTVGLGSAIVCLLVGALGYGAVFMAERARDEASTRRRAAEVDSLLVAHGFELDHEDYDVLPEELPEDATSPLAAEAEYGWPLEQQPEIAHTREG
jgi:uncharacterized membrane protein